MKNIYLLLIILIIPLLANSQSWTIYDGSTTPDAAAPSWNLGDQGTVPTYTIGTEGENSYLSEVSAAADDKGSFKFKGVSWPVNATVIFRTRATGTLEEGMPNTSMEHEVIASPDGTDGYRVNFKLYKHVKGGYIGCNYLPDNPSYPADTSLNVTEWMTIRVTVTNGNEFKLYLNEGSSPIVSATATSATTNSQFLRIGDVGSTFTQGDIDWIAWDATTAYAPGEGTLPEGVIVDTGTTGLKNPSISSTPVKIEFFNINGSLTGKTYDELSDGIYIRKTLFKNGSVKSEKVIINDK